MVEILVARFATEKKKINRECRVNRRLFLPNAAGEVSVRVVNGAREDEIHEMGYEVVHAKKDHSKLFGWATVDETDLRFEDEEIRQAGAEEHNFDRLSLQGECIVKGSHMDIVGWPENPALLRWITQQVARRAKGHLLDGPVAVLVD